MVVVKGGVCHVYVPRVISDMSTDLVVPPYLLHPLIPTISPADLSCAQALGMHSPDPLST